MTSGKNKYQVTALILSVILAVNIIMPSTLFAVNLFCQTAPNHETDTVSVVNTAADCCSELELSSASELSDNQKQVDSCTFERACKQSISDLFTEFQTILPAEIDIKSASVSLSFFNPIHDSNIFSYLSLNHSLSYSTPPIFLLNSTFLN